MAGSLIGAGSEDAITGMFIFWRTAEGHKSETKANWTLSNNKRTDRIEIMHSDLPY
jgi:hypothetical protein